MELFWNGKSFLAPPYNCDLEHGQNHYTKWHFCQLPTEFFWSSCWKIATKMLGPSYTNHKVSLQKEIGPKSCFGFFRFYLGVPLCAPLDTWASTQLLPWVVFIWNPENSGFPVFFPDFRDFPSFSKFRKTGKKSGNPEKNPEIRNFRVKFRISGIAHENHSGGFLLVAAVEIYNSCHIFNFVSSLSSSCWKRKRLIWYHNKPRENRRRDTEAL